MSDNLDIGVISKSVRKILEDLGLRLYDFQYNRVSKTLRIFIDREDGAITIKDCQKVSNLIFKEFNNNDFFTSKLTLEVSSPGVERYLKRPEHYLWAAGKRVVIDVGDKKIKGFIRNTKQDGVVVATESGEQLIPFNSIVKARIAEEIAYGKRR